MLETSSFLSFRYQEALAPLARNLAPPERARIGKRLSELLALLDFSTTLNQSLALSDVLDLLLLVTMGETRASWCGVLLRQADGLLKAAARRGGAGPHWSEICLPLQAADKLERVAGDNEPGLPEPVSALLSSTEADLAVPIRKAGRLIGVLLLGPRARRRGATERGEQARDHPYTGGERGFVEALTIAAAACIDNGRVYEELRKLNRSLSLKVYQLNSLFDVTRELSRALDEASVREVLVASAMGQLLATRSILIQPEGAVRLRGVKLSPDELDLLRRGIRDFEGLAEDVSVEGLTRGPLRSLLASRGLERVVPLRSGSTFYGALLIGRKASGEPLGEEELDFLRSLAAQGAASLDNLRLTREWVEKQKMEKELGLAREIQRGLLPDHDPCLPGWDIAGINIPCLTVGGDYYDYLSGPEGRLGLAIADVSGKGTGPALLMANVQASLRALSGLGELSLDMMLARLNAHIYRSTEANKYLTAFYGWLDSAGAELTYVNAGHCYPLVFRRAGQVERLIVGGPVIGLLPEVSLEIGRTSLGPGDLLVAYTDGLSEARSPGGEEFGEERIIETVRAVQDAPARDLIARLVSAARIYAAEAGLADDLTLLVVKRLEG